MQKYDVYYCDFGKNLGSEQSGLRPCVILQNDKGNKYSPTTIVAPITTAAKKGCQRIVSCGWSSFTEQFFLNRSERLINLV